MYRIIFHVDLDAFFASVEQQDFPELKGKPVIVGADPRGRGVVSACSYEARKYGIHSAMPISTAYRKCPHGVYRPVRMNRYMELSELIMEILQGYTPELRQISVDEAFLDMTGTERLFGPPMMVAKEIKKKVKKITGLTLSIGIAPNRLLAKMASEVNKPDGICRVQPGEEEEFLDKLPLKNLWGIGKKTVERLIELNITDIPKLRRFPEEILCSMLGHGTGSYLYRIVRGEDPGIMSENPKSRSVSNEITFETDQTDEEFIDSIFLELSHQVMFRLLHHQYTSKTVAIKIRYSDFTTISQQKTLKHNIVSAEEIFKTARELFHTKWDQKTAIRLLGVGVSNAEKPQVHTQQELFEDPYSKKHKVEETIFEIQKKMDGATLTKASLLEKKKDFFKRKKDFPGKKDK